MKNFKNLLQYNKFFIIIGLLLVIYVIITTKCIKYNTIYNGSSVSGKVISYKFLKDKLSITIDAQEDTIINYYFKTEEEKNNMFNSIHLGDIIFVEGTINYPNNNTIPNTFNYKNYLYNKRIYVTWNATKIDIKKGNNPLYLIKDYLVKRAYSMNNSEYYLTFVLGDKSLLDSNLYERYQNNGIAHLLCISGMHISIFVLLLSKILSRFKYKNIIIIIFLLFFSFLTSFSSSVLRVVIFYILNIINKKYKLYYNPLHILFMTAYLLVIVNPFIVYDTGFIYSFVISFGIIYYSLLINGNYLIRLLKLSIISFIFSLPITVLLNYELNIMSIFYNIIFVPFVSIFIFPLSIISFIIPFFNPIFNSFITIFNSINSFISYLSVNIIIPKISIIFIVIYYILLIIKNKRFTPFILLIIVLVKLIPLFNNSYLIYCLDVGQGDSLLIVYPNNKTLLIDTGGKVEYQKDNWKISPKNNYLIDNSIKFMKSIGLTHIDYLISSHGDYDHMGEAINLVNNFKVEKVIFNCGPYNELEKELIKVLDKNKIPYYSCIKELNIDKNKLYFLQTKEYDNENDNSNVIYTELNGYKFLFMGDASITTEKDILNKYNLPDIDVLKVGHHGSKTSSSKDFIDEINPKYSVISVGKNNRYGHPNKEVLNNLNNSKIYRIDQDGSIMFKITNNKLKIETCSP